MFYVNKERAKIQNTKLRIEHGTFFWQWKKYIYFSENIGPLVKDDLDGGTVKQKRSH